MRTFSSLFHFGFLGFSLTLGGVYFSDAFAQDAPTSIIGSNVTEHVGETLSLEKLHLSENFKSGLPVILLVAENGGPTDESFLKNLDESLSEIPTVTKNEYRLVVVDTHKFDEGSIAELKTELGINLAHPPGVYLIKPDGKIARYLYGSQILPKDLKFALIETSDQKIGSSFDRMISKIFHFDPIRHSYTVDLWEIVKIVLLIQALIFGIFYYFFWSKKKRPA